MLTLLTVYLQSPLEQFEWSNFTLFACPSGYSSPSMANHAWVLGIYLLFSLWEPVKNLYGFTPGLSGWLFTKLLAFIYQIISDLFIGVSVPVMSILMFTFLAIFFGNFAGMIPYTSAITSSFAVTLSISIGVFVGIMIRSLLQNKLKWFALFMPSGVPLLLIPLLTVIEFISYFSRVFSLAIRLFANILAGHILLKILIVGLATSPSSPEIIVEFFKIFPLTIIFIIIVLEFLVAILQAYVFTLLCSIFLKEGLAGGH